MFSKIITSIILFTFLFVSIGCKPHYGKEKVFDKLHVFYNSDITENEASSFGNYFSGQGLTGGTNDFRIQLARPSGQSYELRFISTKEQFDNLYTNKSAEGKEEFKKGIQDISSKVSKNVFNGAIVVIAFCDKNLKELEYFPMVLSN